MIAEPKNPGLPKTGGLPSRGALSNAGGLPSRAEALALVERARRMRAHTLAEMARAALAWIGRLSAAAGGAQARGRVERRAGAMPHARA